MLKRGIKDFDLIIAYRTFNSGTLSTDYRLLVLNQGKWQRQIFSDKRGHSMEIAKDAFKLCPTNDADCNALFGNLVAGKLFTIEDDRMNPPCTERDTIIKGVKRTYSFGIEDGKQVQIWLITHKKSRRLYYYAPDFYVRYCPYGDRKQLMNLLAILDKGW